MAKMYKKTELSFQNGFVLNGDEVIPLPDGVAAELNAIDIILQQQAYLASQPEPKPERTLEGFERKSTHKSLLVEKETPLLDKAEADSKALLAEIRDGAEVDAINDIIRKYERAFRFLAEPMFVEGDIPVAVDAPMLGDILTLNPNKIIKTLRETK